MKDFLTKGQVDEINKTVSHYRWLDDHLDDFWVAVFGKGLSESGCQGIVGAHGDKGRGYMKRWAEQGICFPHGMALFFLTYTDVMDMEKFQSCEWVIKNYPKYREFLPDIEVG